MEGKKSLNTDINRKKQLPVLTLKDKLISLSLAQMRVHFLVLGRIIILA